MNEDFVIAIRHNDKYISMIFETEIESITIKPRNHYYVCL